MIFKLHDPLFRRIRTHAESRIRFHEIPDRETRTAAYREFYRLEREMIHRYHLKGDSGLRVCRAGAILIDVLLQELCNTALRIYERDVGTPPCPLTIVGLGGYGRCEMSPHSDIDILFLTSTRKENPQIRRFLEIVTEETLYPLWDMRLKIGHSVRNIKQALVEARSEPQSKNALLESRYVYGSEALYRKFDRTYTAEYRKRQPSTYTADQIRAQRERRKKYGDTVFNQEPDIKNGVGGLRDYQLILWLARVRYGIGSVEELVKRRFLTPARMKAFRGSYDFLLRTRNELHFSVSRPTDLLNLDRQPAIAQGLGYVQDDIFERVEAFMQDYYRAARTIRRIGDRLEKQFGSWDMPQKGQKLPFSSVISSHRYIRRERLEGFRREGNQLLIDRPGIFQDDPQMLIRVFRLAQKHDLELDFELERVIEDCARLITRRVIESPKAAASFRSILQETGKVYPTLLQMHDLGILGAYMPEFGRLTCKVQHEYYHRYTADIHVLRTIHELDRIFNGGTSVLDNYRKVLRENSRPGILYLILLLHDIGKADGVKGHDKRGATIAVPILDRLEISERMQQQILFVIRNHLEMARFWQRFDIDDPQTAISFADIVENPEQLRLLFVHTYCDANGTSEDLWNGYKESLHWKLYANTLKQLTHRGADKAMATERKQQLRTEIGDLSEEGIYTDEIDAHFDLLPDRYFMYHSPKEVGLHIRMVHQLLSTIMEADSIGSLVPVVDWTPLPEQDLISVTIVTWDRAGLFYKLAGAFSLSGFNILSTKAISRDDHIAMDTFFVTENGSVPFSLEKAQADFDRWVRAALVENRDLLPEIDRSAARPRSSILKTGSEFLPAPVPSSVNVYHELSLKRTIIEVRAADHIGLLFRITKAITDAGFDIVFARISTDDGIADDTFYIESINPDEVIDNDTLLGLRQTLSGLVETASIAA